MSDKPTILVLEDLPNWQNTIRRLLDPNRYEVVVADSLPAAITLLHSRVIDVAIVDIRLEEGDVTNTEGMIFLEELEKYYPEDRTHAIMLSGHATKELAIDALTRPLRMALDFFLKEKLDEDRLITEVARAVRITHAERPRRLYPLRSFLKTIDISDLAAPLAAEVDSVAATKDLRLLLRNLLLNMLPFATEVKVDIEPLAGITGSVSYMLCWSRKLARALGVSVGCRGTLEILQAGAHWQGVSPTEKMSHWSTQYFDGFVFGLPGVSFGQFLSVAATAS